MPDILKMVKYNADGLVPAVTQDIRTDEVLMLAYMNEESLRKTIETSKAHYFSRSRRKLWLKGETSGHFQQVRSISLDCDGDTLLLKVDQTGAACHTGHRSCFFTRLDLDVLKSGINEEASSDSTDVSTEDSNSHLEGQYEVIEAAGMASNMVAANTDIRDAAGTVTGAGISAQNCIMEGGSQFAAPIEVQAEASGAVAELVGPEVLQEEFDVIADRLAHPKEGSYTNYLFTKGIDKILKKIGEEACEVVIASKNGSGSEIKAEIADLLYHIMVLLVEKGITLQEIYSELKQRK